MRRRGIGERVLIGFNLMRVDAFELFPTLKPYERRRRLKDPFRCDVTG